MLLQVLPLFISILLIYFVWKEPKFSNQNAILFYLRIKASILQVIQYVYLFLLFQKKATTQNQEIKTERTERRTKQRGNKYFERQKKGTITLEVKSMSKNLQKYKIQRNIQIFVLMGLSRTPTSLIFSRIQILCVFYQYCQVLLQRIEFFDSQQDRLKPMKEFRANLPSKQQGYIFLQSIYIWIVIFFIYIIILMEHQVKVSNKPLTYAKNSLERRKELVHLVQDRQWSISKAAKKLGIRPSTGKLIMKKYREEGKFFQKKADRQARLARKAYDTIQQVLQEQQPHQDAPTLLNSQTLPFDYLGMPNYFYFPSGNMNILQNYSWSIADWSFMGSNLMPYGNWCLFN